jgi:hypothetical protein
MADPHHADAHDDYVRGSQEISEQQSTFALFMNLAKWGSLIIAVSLVFLTIWFQPGGSLFAGLITAAILLVAGIWYLRPKKKAH